MKKKNNINNTPLSDYEYDSLWMSYRYCIGRHTISAHSHASDIALNDYHRLTPEQKEQTYQDINDCIYWSLKMSTFFVIDKFNKETMSPLDIFYEFINSENIESYDELKKYKKVVAEYNENDDRWSYAVTMNDEDDKEKYISAFDFEDLEIWQKLANLLNVKRHFMVSVPLDNGKKSDVECYHYYAKRYRSSDNDKFIMHYDKLAGPIDRLNIEQTIYLNV